MRTVSVDEIIAEATARLPGIALDPALHATIAAKRTGDDPVEPTVDGVAEVILALACAAGDAAAIKLFDRDYLSIVPQALSAMKLPPATVDDVRSIVRDKLLLADGDAPPKLVAYAGRGRLKGLVQVTATRAALDHLRHASREVELPARREQIASTDVALALIKAQYRTAFSTGFAAAIAGAPRRDRNLLRLHFLGGVTLESLAQMYNVHRATIVRWLAAAREAVFAATRRHVETELRAPPSELDEMFQLVQSRVELSMDRLLGSISHE